MFRPIHTQGASERTGQRGGSKLNTLLTLAILAALVFTAVKIVPVYVNNFQFQDSIESESRFALAGYPKKSADDIRDDVFKKMQDLSIPGKEEDIRVVVNNNDVDIDLSYTVPINLAVYQFNLQFHPHADNHNI
ncbi:MAG: DUF4845 domain-containing protein [Candidatus Acidiferrales bacterium]